MFIEIWNFAFGLRHENPSYANSSSNRYLYNGKEEQTTGNVGLLDYGARMYNGRIGRWFNIAPMAEKYPMVSTYIYCLNNPLNYTDPTGMIVEDPFGLFEKLKERVKDQLDIFREQLKESDNDEIRGNIRKMISEYSSMLREYRALEKSDQIYRVFSTLGESGMTYWENHTIMVDVGNGDYGLVAHELKHAYQYESGQISFEFKNGKNPGSLYDITDETAAYNRERLMYYGISFYVNENGEQWSDEDVRQFRSEWYGGLESGPIDINSREGKAMRNNTNIIGIFKNQNRMNIYKGYGQDMFESLKRINRNENK